MTDNRFARSQRMTIVNGALVLAVGLPLLGANAIKSVVLIPTSLVALALFAMKGNMDWTLGVVMAAGSMAGGLLGVRLAEDRVAGSSACWSR